MGCISGIVKTIMFIFNFACLLIGLVLLVLGSFIYVAVDDYKKNFPGAITAVPIALIIIGVFIFLVSFLGCCGAIKSNKCMLMTYAIILIILLVIQLVVGIIGLVSVKSNYEEFKNNIKEELIKVLEKYDKDGGESKAFMDALQSTFLCCGAKDKFDYISIVHMTNYPGSCCGKKMDYCTNADTIYDTGCGDSLFATIDKYITIISIVAIVICAVELLGAIFAIYLSRKK